MAPQSKLAKKSKGKSIPKAKSKERQTVEAGLHELRKDLEKKAAENRRVQNKSGEGTPNSSQSSVSVVLSNPEALGSDLIQEMRNTLNEIRQERQEQAEKINKLTVQCETAAKSEIAWKKEGNKKQHEILKSIVHQNNQARIHYALGKNSLGAAFQDSIDKIAANRTKLLRIADTSVNGWATVLEYEQNPIAESEADDKKLRNAEKTAKEKATQRAQERKTKQSRFSPYNPNNRGYQYRNQDYNAPSNENPQGYRSYGGYKSQHPYKNSTVAPDKPLPKRSLNNDICFHCGGRGHWAHSCPERKQESEK